jgi:hypothetical protein
MHLLRDQSRRKYVTFTTADQPAPCSPSSSRIRSSTTLVWAAAPSGTDPSSVVGVCPETNSSGPWETRVIE